jgi:dTDP-4-amino-4,6-dideoxygalactose transaminase
MNVPFFRPTLGDEEKSAVDAVLSSGWLTTGPAVQEFQRKFANFVGRRYAIAVNSCTAALHLALEAAGVREGDSVFVPTMTFAATAEVVHYLHARPVLVDCDPQTLCMDPEALEASVNECARHGPVKAVMPMHYGGQMADMHRITDLARRFGMEVIEDAAHALPAFTREAPEKAWQSVGSFSIASCFSFYANKCITTGEGGMVATDEPELAQRMQMMSLHGLSRDAWSRFTSHGSWYYEILQPGFKYNLTDLAASIGCVQLDKANGFWERRRVIEKLYRERLISQDEILELPTEQHNRMSSWHLYPIRLRLENLAINRSDFIQELKRRGIGTSVHWMPLHLHPFYRETYGYRAEEFPAAFREWRRLISLPIFPSITSDELDYICESIAEIGKLHRLKGSILCATA